jgi:hypothetical protein
MLARLWRMLRPWQASERGAAAFDQAMRTSGDLIGRFKHASESDDPIRAMFADMWLERHNVPYVTTMYQANQEMIQPLRQQSTSGNSGR